MPDSLENISTNESSPNCIILDGGENIGRNQDFNDYTTIGNYDINTAEDISTAQNMPVNSFGRLIVSIPGTVDTTYCYRRQDFIPYTTLNAILYTRYARSDDGGETWIWRPWMTVQDTLYAATPIDSDSDLNSFTNPGAFVIRTAPLAATILNIPIDKPGRLFVMDMLGSYERITNDVYIRQFFVLNNTTEGIYSRDSNSTDFGETWHWQEWQLISENSKDGAVLYNMQQSLNEAQKAQARQNIGITSIEIVLPPYSSTDIGKTLGVVDDGNGNAILAWVEGGVAPTITWYQDGTTLYGVNVPTITSVSQIGSALVLAQGVKQ